MARPRVNRLAHRLLPGAVLLARYDRGRLRGDLVAGITVAAYLIPQVMAYATVAGLPPVAGLWAILAPLALYALLGSSRQLSVGPESTTALMTAVAVGPLAAGDPARYAALAAALAVLVGLLCLLCWAMRLGFVADLLSRPILVGYMTGVALIMIVGQLGKLTGIPVSGESLFAQLASFVDGLPHVHAATLLLAGAILAFLFTLRWFLPRAPAPLLAVLMATAAVAVFGLERYGIRVVGAIPSGLPAPSPPTAADLASLLLPATGVLLVGYTDNILTARSFAARRGYEIDANQELLALGAANIGAGLLRGFPVSSSGSRTALGDAAGGRTQVLSLVALAAVIAVLLFAGPLLASFPSAALGAIVVYAAARLIDVAGFRRLAAFRRSEFLLALGAFSGVLAFDILYGVLAAVGLSVAEMLSRIARPHDAILGTVPGLAGMHDVDDYPQARTLPGLVVYRYDSPLFFANAEDFRRRALAAVDQQEGPVSWFVLNAESNVEVDFTGLDAVDSLRRELERRGVVFAMARVKQDLRDALDAFGLTARVGPGRIFPTLPTAVAAYEQWRRESPDAGDAAP
ncbi:high affinity sulfate transporter 1 [Streptosporangium becharense]|uniref:High affinity sulfate transporter 1 n=1 Tax=Streptosporangium becharense TaxID=1816182 RepID=A0A7W9MJG8_9ACTN|nr:sulfate permease [Streptosporangium becharense]MBB2910469.1 high affinity sulfate transporter 1 [Streptosporangium becharense]MBB5823212.1 high affinity sulfate transporter 1 [Streptosporangium becharense]